MNNVVILNAVGESFERPAYDADRIADLSPSAISYWGRDLTCRYANRACRDWLGVDPEILVGCELVALLEGMCLDAHLEYVEAALQGERRTAVQSFHEGPAMRDGLVQYIPDMRGHVVLGVLIQVSPTPPVPQLARRRRST